MEDLELVLIVGDEGKCLVFQSFGTEVDYSDKEIFSGFVLALTRFANQVFKTSIKKFSTARLDLHYLPVELKEKKFFVILGAKKQADINYIHNKIKEISDAFVSEYGEMDISSDLDEDFFVPFIDTIDKIFGIKTVRIIPEHAEFVGLLELAEQDEYTEEMTVNTILTFLESLPQSKLKILLQNTLPILTMFMESDNLSDEQIERFQTILNI